jgi:glycosyltransferase involved in cell wall biosynthesis
MGFPKTDVLPVVPSFEHLDVEPNRLLAGRFDDDWTNILFVGRMIPNKRIEDLIRFFHAYRLRYTPRARLLLVGSYGGFAGYLAALQHLSATLRVSDVHFIGHISNEELTAFYDVADLFLSASEHEGFCVPLVEAFYKRIPVMAYAAAAVPATMDGGGVLYENKDPRHVAALMNAVLSDGALEQELLRAQDAALARLLAKDFSGTLLGFIDGVLDSPRRGPHEVTWDFWDQCDEAERLEDLRQYRPAAYQGLPKEPGARRPGRGSDQRSGGLVSS